MPQPVHEWFSQPTEDCICDKHTRIMTHGLIITKKIPGYIISFVYALVTCLQSNIGFTNIEEIIHIYKETREKTDEVFQSVYVDAVSLASEFGIEEKLCHNQ